MDYSVHSTKTEIYLMSFSETFYDLFFGEVEE